MIKKSPAVMGVGVSASRVLRSIVQDAAECEQELSLLETMVHDPSSFRKQFMGYLVTHPGSKNDLIARCWHRYQRGWPMPWEVKE